MAGQPTYNLTAPETQFVWEKNLEREIRPRDPLLDPDSGFAGEGPDALMQQKDQLTDGPGAWIRTKLKYQLSARGRQGEEVLKGHEEPYLTATFDTYVNVFRHAFGVSSPFVQQQVSENVLQEGTDGLADFFASRFSFTAHAHACGLSMITDPAYTLHNTINAINSQYIIRPNNKAAGALVQGDKFDVDLMNVAARLMKKLRPKIRPAKTKYGDRYCVFLTPGQVKDLRDSNSLWFQKMTAAAQGGRIDDNPLWTTALGEDQGFIFFESDFVPPGLDAAGTSLQSNTARAWIGGAQALILAFGRGYDSPGFGLNRFQWIKDTEDYGQQKQIAASTIVGIARPRFTKPGEASARELGVVVVETYDAMPNGFSNADAYGDWINAGCNVV